MGRYSDREIKVKVTFGLLPLMAMTTIVLVILQITGTISWPWGLIFLPLWGPLTAMILVWVVFVIIMVIVSKTKTPRRRKK